MKKLGLQKGILLTVFLCVGLGAAVLLYVRTLDLSLSLGAAAVTAVLFGLLLLYGAFYNTYMERTIIQLSELLDSITHLDEREIFSVTEDSLLSRLQCQVLKLTGILRARAAAAEEEKNEIKSLISNLSHQLKTPVASLKLYGELLEDDALTPAQRAEYLAVLRGALEKLVFLTDTMIKMTRLESGIVVLEPQFCDIGETILAAIAPMFRQARDKGLELLHTEPAEKTELPHDPKWTAEALLNILDNAVKYTEKGQISISTQRYEMYFRIDIADTGAGIPEAEQPLVFQRFFRGKNTAGAQGAGIGLYLSRTIITGQGGYIKLRSAPSGSTFSVFLPRSRGAQ